MLPLFFFCKNNWEYHFFSVKVGHTSKDLKILNSTIWKLLSSFRAGSLAGFGASGWNRWLRSTSRLAVIQEPEAFFIFVFSVIYFLHLRFLKTRNRWTNPGCSQQTAYPTPRLEKQGSPAERSLHRIICSCNAWEWTLRNFRQLAFPLAPLSTTVGKMCPCLTLGGTSKIWPPDSIYHPMERRLQICKSEPDGWSGCLGFGCLGKA